MNVLTALFEVFPALFGLRQPVRGHKKSQVYGPAWSKHRPRKINGYKRKRVRRSDCPPVSWLQQRVHEHP
ncbi:MAG: hypothetical protein JSV19_00010 [Phycisphaerales bacterium]|nr:MAG: hypothetical protein JSV19_00010 [Phycisphaerales bacterium]